MWAFLLAQSCLYLSCFWFMPDCASKPEPRILSSRSMFLAAFFVCSKINPLLHCCRRNACWWLSRVLQWGIPFLLFLHCRSVSMNHIHPHPFFSQMLLKIKFPFGLCLLIPNTLCCHSSDSQLWLTAPGAELICRGSKPFLLSWVLFL